MHVPQSPSSTASPLSYVSAKPRDWTHQRPPTPIAASSMPHAGTHMFAEPGGVAMPPSRAMYYPVMGPFAPSMPPVPLPDPNQPPSSRHTSHSSRSSHSFHSPSLHPLLNMIRVPQDLSQCNFSDPAFRPLPKTIKIKFCPEVDALVLPNTGSVALILQTLHEQLHARIPRGPFNQLRSSTQTIAHASFSERKANGRVAPNGDGIRMLDVLGFGTKTMIFVGLQQLDKDHWAPSFMAQPRNA
ncbi:hypothetical protein B0H15DRAFT_946633 [Mycena belliarum]|uniref:DUF6699 domain-containing protein n=1 Tax=Mycena belliarum TaxID=1033014 RepID=A0AAD6U8J3_9AGAR|nr:hypothetical protein B0H15DRAFT_946633 [Mycena belliae]